MATTHRDYYEILGVGRSAGETEIKKAFRRLARTLHPDVSGEPDAQERFREVVEAYEVLSKPETRELYDRFGHDLFGVTARPRRARGADVAAQVEIELVEAATGTTREVPFPVTIRCETCGGSGAEPGTEPVTCPSCGGAGRGQQG